LLETFFSAHAASPTPQNVTYPDVVPGYAITFPRDEGSHPEFRIEWWYITGWLKNEAGDPLGFQITFFRTRPGLDESNPSRFAAKQVLFAHIAVSDPARGQLLRAERSARAGFSLAQASEQTLDVRLDEWSLRKEGVVYRAQIASDEFAMDFIFQPTQPPLLQGRDGFSQKGPAVLSASYYYSLPQLRTRGTLVIGDRKHPVSGEAWFDHEWSSAIMDQQAAGWDWAGINLHDGTAVMAFQMRNREQREHWAAATSRKRGESPQTFAPDQIEWTPLRRWRSPRTSIEYPIEWRVRIGGRVLTLKPLMDDQENDARNSTGTLYWEGAVRAFDETGAEVGKGYLELTGYGKANEGVTR
jgi:predicted secreted hydrolase